MDAGLVALAYYLAFRVRFDGGIPSVYTDLFRRTLAWAVFGSVLCFALVGVYRHWMRHSAQREYFKIAEGTVLAVLSLVGYVAIIQPQLVMSASGLVSLNVPAGVLVLFGLLMGAFLTATRCAVYFFSARLARRNGVTRRPTWPR